MSDKAPFSVRVHSTARLTPPSYPSTQGHVGRPPAAVSTSSTDRNMFSRRPSQVPLLRRIPSTPASILSPLQSPILPMSEALGLDGYKTKIHLLLIFSVLGFISHLLNWSPVITFSSCFIGVIPLGTLLGKATEDIAEHTNDTIGAVLNVTSGNAVELILSIAAMRADRISLVEDTIVGSIMSNLLLVLGSSFFVGGVFFKEQEVCEALSENNANMLLFAVFGFSVPALFAISVPESARIESSLQTLSLLTALTLLSLYLMFMIFQLHTHADLYQPVTPAPMASPSSTAPQTSRTGSSSRARSQLPLDDSEPDQSYPFHSSMMVKRSSSSRSNQGGAYNSNTPHTDVTAPPPLTPATYEPVTPTPRSHPSTSLFVALCVLVVTIVFVTVLSHGLVATLEEFSKTIGLGQKLIAVVLLPVVVNAVQHLSAIMVAGHNKIDMSIGIACGSSLQMALFVAPILVVLSWVFGYSRVCLNFELFQTVCLGFTVLLVNATLRDSRTNWLEGALLLMCYFVVVAAISFLK